MTHALIGPAYGEVMALKKHFNLVYGIAALQYLLSAPTAAQLSTWLATPANLDEYQKLVGTPNGAVAVCASSGAMAAIAGSATARERLFYSSTGRAALTSSKTAMDAVLGAGAAAISSMLSYADIRIAIYDNTTAFNSLVASADGKSALSGMAPFHTTASTVHVYPTGGNAATRMVLVSQKISLSGATSHAGALTDTYSTTSTSFVDRFVRVTGLTHRSTSTTPAQIYYVVMQ